MLAQLNSIALKGLEAFTVFVEVDLANGLPAFVLVGLPDHEVLESRQRVSSAIRNSGFRFPPRRITVNLGPAQARKEGTQFDLAIALGLLRASGQCPGGEWPKFCGFVGELALDGSLRGVPGVFAMALQAKASGARLLVVPADNLGEARASGMPVKGVATLREAVEFLASGVLITNSIPDGDEDKAASAAMPSEMLPITEDMSDVRGQGLAKRALEIAAAGGHHVLFFGPPGVGKSMLARRLVGLLPAMTPEETQDIARIQSLAGLSAGLNAWPRRRPFRAPHPSSSSVSLIGGGMGGRPGEISLAHGGVLFLDELSEFGRQSLEALRQPLEERRVCVSRAGGAAEYPARFQLVAATNPCPCGYAGAPQRACRCTPLAVRRHMERLSGPWLDRIDLQLELAPVAFRDWAGASARDEADTSPMIRSRVEAAQRIQRGRSSGELNAFLPPKDLKELCALGKAGLELLEEASRRFSLSARRLDRVLRVSRTIADLAGCESVEKDHMAEALQMRAWDRLEGRLRGGE